VSTASAAAGPICASACAAISRSSGSRERSMPISRGTAALASDPIWPSIFAAISEASRLSLPSHGISSGTASFGCACTAQRSRSPAAIAPCRTTSCTSSRRLASVSAARSPQPAA